MRAGIILVYSIGFGGCIAQTGGNTAQFPVAAAGPADAISGQPLSFTSGAWDVVLTQATLHVGAVYLDQSQSISGGQATGCYSYFNASTDLAISSKLPTSPFSDGHFL